MTFPPDTERSQAWRLLPLVEFHWRRWGDEWLVFDRGSGQTHRLDTLTALSLMVLEDAPATLGAIETAISGELGLDAEDSSSKEHFSRLPDILERLRQSGLVHSRV